MNFKNLTFILGEIKIKKKLFKNDQNRVKGLFSKKNYL